MLTFFRRIRLRLMNQSSSDTVRKGLLDGGASRKYILYAVGEIALVVIGILIALQINNWIEWRKDRAKEKVILLELEVCLEKNIDLLNGITDNLELWSNSGDIIISAIENNENLHRLNSSG